MMSSMKWVGSLAAIVLLAGVTAADDQIYSGKIKSVDAVKKSFVLTNADGKDSTFKFGDNMIVNRDGKESASELKADEPVHVCYDKGVLTWTAHYILVQANDNKDCYLTRCTIRGYDADKKELAYTDGAGKDLAIPMGDSKVRLNGKSSKVEEVKAGDKALAIMEKVGEKHVLKELMIERTK